MIFRICNFFVIFPKIFIFDVKKFDKVAFASFQTERMAVPPHILSHVRRRKENKTSRLAYFP